MCRVAGDGDRQAREPSPSSASSAPRTSTASPCSYPAASRQGSFFTYPHLYLHYYDKTIFKEVMYEIDP